MEIARVNNQCLRIKGKKTTLLVDSNSLSVKTPADGILSLNPDEYIETSKIEGYRIIMQGPGEYEVGGVKISGIGSHDTYVYHLEIDGVQLLLGKAQGIEKLQEKLRQCSVALIQAETPVKPALIPALEASLVILYGSQAQDALKAIGKEALAGSEAVSKVTVTADKLPAEMEITVLG